ncbi:DUF4129 domain-containing protein [Phytoactinopolyspora limicola]|uniref:DUF4129 domain-containing protein n=1 Tax=Phytoactinopolyspora limicola TaxID=2715536 RepID=UPI00140B641E|nr:DUF4129 domain-containing protein [Phytoactinopolyspora limicola]
MGNPGYDRKDNPHTGRRFDRRIGALLPALAVFATAALLVISIAGLGRIELDPPDWQVGSGAAEPSRITTPAPAPTDRLIPIDPDDTDGSLPSITIPWEAALATLIIVIVAVAIVLLRRLPRGRFGRRGSSVVGGHIDDSLDQSHHLRAAVETASTTLDARRGSGSDAIIDAWQHLEAAAEESGAPRRPAQTPSEFTAGLLRHHHADEIATARLRDLYHRARFSTRPDVTPADVDTARAALETIMRTLHAPSPDLEAGQDAPTAPSGPDAPSRPGTGATP